MDYKYKKIKKDWTSRDSRFRYRKGDEVMVLKEDDKYHTVALDVAIVGCIPNEYFEDGDDLKDAGVLGLVKSKFTKDLLLKDLCARLPYQVKVSVNGGKESWTLKGMFEGEHTGTMLVLEPSFPSKDASPQTSNWQLSQCKPYLRPMSSMTEEEKLEFSLVPIYAFVHYNEIAKMDWLNEHHFDYRGLIPKDLALSTNEFNPYKD